MLKSTVRFTGLLRILLAAGIVSVPGLWAGSKGPDAGRYTATDATVYSFIDIAGAGGSASVLADTDDGAVLLTLPFPFQFYGHVYTTVCVSSNGLLTFVAAEACGAAMDFANADLSVAGPPDDAPAIMPMWSDLTFQAPGAGAVYYQAFGTAGSRRFIVQWNNAYPQESANPVTFQVILSESRNQILFQYKTVDLGSGNAASRGATASIGIRDAAGNTTKRQIAWSYNAGVLANETALLFAIAAHAPQKIGTYSSSGLWQLDVNGNGAFDAGTDMSFFLGWPGATIVTGDWNGDGRTKVGVYSGGFWFLDYNGNGVWDGGDIDRQIGWGWVGATPVVGDWNGDGRTKIGVWSAGFWFLDYDGDFAWNPTTVGGVDKQVGWGWVGATPVVGDWNGDGKAKIGVYSGGFWFLDYDGDYVWNPTTVGGPDKQVGWGWDGAQILVGDWNGDGRTKIGVTASNFFFLDYDGDYVWNPQTVGGPDKQIGWGWPGTTTVFGDWNGDGRSKIGLYNGGQWLLDWNGDFVFDVAADKVYSFGGTGDVPVVGRW